MPLTSPQEVFYKIFLTGGAGYFIGSHTFVNLLHAMLDVTVFDSFYISHSFALARLGQIT